MEDLKFEIKTSNNYSKEFSKIAENILNNYVLFTQKNEYQLCEIEFYLNDEKNHKDDSTHNHAHQKSFGKWYCHRYNNSDSIKKGNRKGLDFTLGNEKYYFSILIRAIQNTKNDEDYICGPSKLLDRIFSESKMDSENLDAKSVFDFDKLKLEKSKQKRDEEIIACPRYGLGKNTPKPFIDLPYRFFTKPIKEHKGKENVIIYLFKNGWKIDDLKTLFNRKTLNELSEK